MKSLYTTMSLLLLVFTSYAQIYEDYLGAGHAEDVVVQGSGSDGDVMSTIDASGLNHNLIDASRFLSHATLGADLELIRFVDSIGYDAWLDQQFAIPSTSYSDILRDIDSYLFGVWVDTGRDSLMYRTRATQFRYAWTHVMTQAPDLLRHRVALALSEILVISSNSDLAETGFGLASYYDVLSRHAFGNYQDLLMEVSLHPCMGFYLSHYNNPLSIPSENIHPDENYAREIMQLFTIGLYELNLDGTRILDSAGAYIPTYDNDDIKELAKVFTGLGMGGWFDPDIPQPPRFGVPFLRANHTIPMRMYEPWHEPGAKTIIGDFEIPAGQTGLEDIAMAVEHLFNHPNVGPFVSTHLIKRLVKSNPTPEYVARIASVFNDNGNGERGDLQAVVRAILLDPEARDCIWTEEPNNGRLKEPLQRYTQLIRSFNATSDAGVFWDVGFTYNDVTEQFVLHAPSVFNFFLPDYIPNGAFADEGLVGPEYQLLNSSTALGYINYGYFTSIVDYINDVPAELRGSGLEEQFEAYRTAEALTILRDYPDALIDYFDLVLAHGNMTEKTRQIIYDTVLPLESVERDYMLRLALYLTILSPDFTVMK